MHTSYQKGTPLWIKLKNNQEIEGKFFDHKSGKVILEGKRIIPIKSIRAISIRKLK